MASSKGKGANESSRYNSSYSQVGQLPLKILCDWLQAIDDTFFTLVFLNNFSRDRPTIQGYLYLLTGVTESDRLPSTLGLK